MKIIIFSMCCLVLSLGLNAQRLITRTGEISFFSQTKIEDISAHNKTSIGVIDVPTGAIQISVTIKGFHFEKALMEEHFNENYMESDAFPKATFKGELVNKSSIHFGITGTYTSSIKGVLTIHGVSLPIVAQGTFKVLDQGLIATATIEVSPQKYNIEIPGIVADKISDKIEVKIKMHFKG